jgi:hypothetical protein
MKRRDIIFCLFLQVFLALVVLLLSISTQASSSGKTHHASDEIRHQEFVHRREEHSQHVEEKVYHGEELNNGKELQQGKELHHGKEIREHIDKEVGHDTSHEAKDHTDLDHQADVPLVYLFYWGILILVMVIILIYFVYAYKSHRTKPVIPLAVFLILFGLSIYILEIITTTFSGKFDLSTLRIIHEFHEGPDLGFLRFIYKFILGIFMTFFAFLNLDRKKFRSIENREE